MLEKQTATISQDKTLGNQIAPTIKKLKSLCLGSDGHFKQYLINESK